DRLVSLRTEILDGDLRPLYLAHLAVAFDSYHNPDEEKEPPVPSGLDQLTDAQRALMELHGLSESLIAAAAQNTPRFPKRGKSQNQYEAWLQQQPETTKNAWLAQLMADPRSTVRREILAEFQKSQRAVSWPVTRLDRTIGELGITAEKIESEKNR